MMIEFSPSDLDKIYYVSGPMTGYPDFNYPAFHRCCNRLRPMGFKIISPHEIKAPTQAFENELAQWEWYMRQCEEQFTKVTGGIIMLRGWPESSGANRELGWALARALPVYLYLETPGRLVRMSR
jgi:nucleoside 2-deoxyribosyltransferase